jgi:hypothetical protein
MRLMTRHLIVVCLMTALAIASLWAQSAPAGEITGRAVDAGGGTLPGVQIVVSAGDVKKTVVTDANGRFMVNGLQAGSHVLTATLAGFVTRTIAIDLPYAAPRAFVEAKLDIGCLSNPVRVQFDARSAARLVSAIAHVRVSGAQDYAQWVTGADCSSTWRDVRATAVQTVVGSVPASASSSRATLRLFVQPIAAAVFADREYIVLMWETTKGSDVWHTHQELLLPVVDGKIDAPWDKGVHGLTAPDVLTRLAQWARERGR